MKGFRRFLVPVAAVCFVSGSGWRSPALGGTCPFPNPGLCPVDRLPDIPGLECGLRAYVGPVLSYYEFIRGGLKRMNDEEWAEALNAGEEELERPRWTESILR